MRAIALASLVVSIGSIGCASFRSGAVPPTQPWPPAAAASKKSISLVLAGSATQNNGTPIDPPPGMVSKWRTWTEAAYRDSALFSAVLAEDLPSDVRAEVRITDTGEGSQGLAFISGLTLTLIPAKATDTITLHTEFKSSKGELLATIEKSDSLHTWIQLFMVFVMPFHWPASEAGSLFTELNRATLAEAHAQGVI